jgi:hypothetical protein
LRPDDDSDDRDLYLSLGEWVAALKAAARDLGTAVVDRVAVDAGGLRALEENGLQAVVLALALAEMPDLS